VKAALHTMADQVVNVALAILLLGVWLGLTAYLDSQPSETDAAQAVADDKAAAVIQAQRAARHGDRP
jgi:hypothetical protein